MDKRLYYPAFSTAPRCDLERYSDEPVPGELQISPEFGGFWADAYHLFMRYTKRQSQSEAGFAIETGGFI